MKYLEIIFDRSLSFACYVDDVIHQVGDWCCQDYDCTKLLMQELVMSSLDYGLGLLIMTNLQLTKFERIQNEARRLALVWTKDTPVVAHAVSQ